MAERTSGTPDPSVGGGPSALPSSPTISTRIVADEADRPAAGVHVTLYKLGEDDRAIRLTQALTDDAGRVADLLGRPMSPGVYRLEFNLAGGGFFRRLTVDLRVEDVGRSYEVPLVVGSGSLRVAGGD